jgi:pimeloyl-ACP methyl ester carboxylesterase
MRTIGLSLLALLGACTAPRLSPEQMRSTPPKRHALAAPEPRSIVSVLGVELALHDSDPSGAKPAIFCLHAIGHGGSDFASFERAFADRFRVISVDWPGQGASAPDTKPASAIRYAALFEQLVQRLGTQSIVVLGNSIGGAVAIRYAAAHPENTRALILADSAGLDSNPGGFLPSLVIGHYQNKFESGARGDVDFKPWFRDWYASVLITPEARTQRDAIVESAYEIAPVLVQAWASFKAEENDVRALAKGLTMPVFVAWAEHDEVIQWSRNRAAVQQIPNAKVQLFDAGHAAFLEQPAAFKRAAGAFLAGL